MAENKLKSLRPVILTFLVVIIGVAFITANANTTSQLTNSQPIANESINFASAHIAPLPSINTSKSFTVASNPTVNSNLSLDTFVLTNASGSVATVNTDYVVNLTAGTFTLQNTSIWTQNLGSNVSLASYHYYAANYVQNSGGRTMFSLIDFFSALGVLLVCVVYLYRSEIFEYLGF